MQVIVSEHTSAVNKKNIMTDFYKKIYGYEDDIQLEDNDIKILQEGMFMLKMNQSKEGFNKRYYKLDLDNNQLVASTKEFRKKEKLCKFFFVYKNLYSELSEIT